jgi:hypothetical protein
MLTQREYSEPGGKTTLLAITAVHIGKLDRRFHRIDSCGSPNRPIKARIEQPMGMRFHLLCIAVKQAAN